MNTFLIVQVLISHWATYVQCILGYFVKRCLAFKNPVLRCLGLDQVRVCLVQLRLACWGCRCVSRRRFSSSRHTHYSSQSAADTLSGHSVSTDAKQQHRSRQRRPRTHTGRHAGHALPPAGRRLAHRSVRFTLSVCVCVSPLTLTPLRICMLQLC